jgi:DNA-binding transcriptional MocR family regulator
LFEQALARGISITPGSLFSPSNRYERHLRLSACYPFSDRHVHALVTLGELASAQLR